jgi:PHD/YefM family antitoxin component YafN of YafNO toxin-antitoxin module
MDGMGKEQPSDADWLAAAAADGVEAGRGPVAVTRPGHKPVVMVSVEEWRHLEELDSAESTAWWRREAAERAALGEEPGAGEEGSGLDEAEFRRRFAHLLTTLALREPTARSLAPRRPAPRGLPA